MSSRLAALALLAVTAVWGSTFFLIKDLLDRLPVADFLAVRFALAAVVMFAISPRTVVRLSPRGLRASAIAGAVYGAAQLLQTYGLAHTDASISGFITGMYVVMAPVLAAVVLGVRIGRRVWLAVALATFGLGVLSLRGLSLGVGETVTVLSAALYAVHIVVLSRWARTEEAYAMATVQMAVIAAICFVLAAPGGIALPGSPGDWLVVVYMAVAASAFALAAQTWAQAQLSAARAAILMTMEPVFAAAFAVGLGNETLGWRVAVGGAFVLAAMLVAELRTGRAPRTGLPRCQGPEIAPRHESLGRPAHGAGDPREPRAGD